MACRGRAGVTMAFCAACELRQLATQRGQAGAEISSMAQGFIQALRRRCVGIAAKHRPGLKVRPFRAGRQLEGRNQPLKREDRRPAVGHKLPVMNGCLPESEREKSLHRGLDSSRVWREAQFVSLARARLVCPWPLRKMPVMVSRVERQLCVIFAADIVGYSTLMRRDEEGTLAQLAGASAPSATPKLRLPEAGRDQLVRRSAHRRLAGTVGRLDDDHRRLPLAIRGLRQ